MKTLMKFKKVNIVFILVLCSTLYSQICFERFYGGEQTDTGSEVIQTADGGYLFSAYSTSYGPGLDVLLIRTDPGGDTLWTRVYGGSGDDMAEGIVQTDDGGYAILVATSSKGAGGLDYSILKINSDGDLLWEKTYGGSRDDCCFSIDYTNDGGFIMAGYQVTASSMDIYIVKVDHNGNQEWDKVLSQDVYNFARYIIQTSDGGYVYTGYISSGNPNVRSLLIGKIDADGNTVWTRTSSGGEIDFGFCIQETSENEYIIAGRTTSYGAGDSDVYLVKADNEGHIQWYKTYGGPKRDLVFSIVQTDDGGYAMAGITESYGQGPSDVYLLRTDSNGDTLWTRTFGGDYKDESYDLTQTSDEGFAIVGGHYFLEALTEKAQLYLIKTDNAGTVTGVKPIQYHNTPKQFVLKNNYPNPFNTTTQIRYQLKKQCEVKLSILNISGQVLTTIVSGMQPAGIYQYEWNAANFPTGTYFCRIVADHDMDTKKLIYLK